MKRLAIALLASCLLCIVGCQRTKPQAPSHRTEKDSSEMALLLMNQRLAVEADRELAQYVNHVDSGYVLSEWNVWYKYLQRTDEPRWKRNEQVLLHAQVYTLEGQLLVDSEEVIVLGKGETLQAIETMVLEMRRDEACRILSPWYLAYGVSGSNEVPPYMNVKIDLETRTID